MSKKIFTLCCFVILGLVSAPRMSFASTVTLYVEATSGSPYIFDINGAPTYTSLTCLNDNRTINTGESWSATATTLDVLIAQAKLAYGANYLNYKPDGTITIEELEADAYLDTLYNSNATNNQEVQDAIWTILDASGVSNPSSNQYVYTGLSTPTEDNAVKSDYAAAIASLTNSMYNTSSFYSEFTFYAPISGTYHNDKSGGIPQEFLGYKAVTPEPSSLILLGTGLAGLAGGLRRRMKTSKQA